MAELAELKLILAAALLLPVWSGCASVRSRGQSVASNIALKQPARTEHASQETTAVAARISMSDGVIPRQTPKQPDQTEIATVSNEMVDEHHDDGLFHGAGLLDSHRLADLVQQRNPTLQAMYAAWQVAAAKYPQEISLDDPMLDLMMAPASFASSSNVPESWALEASQKIPWRGKRAWRGHIANANTRAAAFEAEDSRLEVASAARIAFADYLEAELSLSLNEREEKLLGELRAVASVRYETNQGQQQDVLQATVELADVKRRRMSLVRQKRIAMARINALLHRPPTAFLPAPSQESSFIAEVPSAEQLLSLAIQNRPDLAAQGARIDAEWGANCLAAKEFYPDFELYGRYDKFWFDREQQGSVGVKLNLPVQRDRRRAAVQEALARISQANAEYEAQVDSIREEVQSARERLVESSRIVDLFRDEIIEVSEQNVASARASYEAGRAGFLALVSAQRQLIDFRQKQIEAAAEYQRQSAQLDRAVGSVVAAPAGD